MILGKPPLRVAPSAAENDIVDLYSADGMTLRFATTEDVYAVPLFPARGR